MRSMGTSRGIASWAMALLLTLGIGSSWLAAQDVLELGAPGEAPPDVPGLFDLGGSTGGEEASPKGRDKDPEVTVTWSPLPGDPGTAVLAIHIALQDGANTYDLQPSEGFRKNTKITFGDIAGATPIDTEFVADHEPKVGMDENFGKVLRKYLHEVTFSRRYKVEGTPGAAAGKIDMLVCRSSCTPHKLDLNAEWSDSAIAGTLPAAWTGAAPIPAPEAAATGEESLIEVESAGAPMGFGYAMVMAFLGGLIMNVMPCVLPVIAIKVLSFVQQAGENRSRILALNVAYAIGVIVVFLGLGTLATFARIGLGELFQNDWFNVVMACIVFAMGLSLLGVFEIQLPGALGGGSNEQEGLPGAFFTGILATLLATPCIGPFVSGVLVWSVTQPTHVIYAVWGMLGLGMASPYLLIGAFPALLEKMPRPGMWMVRFKEFSGFVLMGTVIFLINSVSSKQLIPTLIILLGIALGLWMIGNLYDHSSTFGHKWKVRLAALSLCAPLMYFGVSLMTRTSELPWEPFSEARMVELRQSGKPILIDFTADWCTVCKANEHLALNTKITADFVKKNNVVCLKADYTDESEEIKAWLKKFGAAGVPLTVVFPPGPKSKGIPFHGLFTQAGLLKSMNDAWGKEQASMQASSEATTVLN